MTATEFLLLSAAALAGWGVFTAWLAGRLGRDRFGWWLLGTFLGPLVLPALMTLVRDARRRPPQVWALDPRTSGTSGSRVLAVARTGPGLIAAASAVRDRLGWMDPAVSIAIVADADHAFAGSGGTAPEPGWERAVRTPFDEAERALGGIGAEREVLFGELVPAVNAELSRGAYALAVLGPEAGQRRAAAKLIRNSPVPVLLAAGTRRPARISRPALNLRRPLIHIGRHT